MFLKSLLLSSVHRSLYFILIGLVMGLCLLHPVKSLAAGIPASLVAKSNTNEIEAEVKIPEGLSPDEVDEYLKGLSDEQARQVLARRLKQETAGNSASDVTGDGAVEEDPADQFFHKLTLGASLVSDQIASFFSSKSEKEGAQYWQAVLNRLSGGRGIGHIGLTLLIGLGMIACGMVVERLVLRLTANLQEQILTSVTLGKLQRITRFISHLLLELLGIGAYIVTTFILLIPFFATRCWIVWNTWSEMNAFDCGHLLA